MKIRSSLSEYQSSRPQRTNSGTFPILWLWLKWESCIFKSQKSVRKAGTVVINTCVNLQLCKSECHWTRAWQFLKKRTTFHIFIKNLLPSHSAVSCGETLTVYGQASLILTDSHPYFSFPHIIRTTTVTKATRHITPYIGSSVSIAAITPCLSNHQRWASLKARHKDGCGAAALLRSSLSFLRNKFRNSNMTFWYTVKAFFKSIYSIQFSTKSPRGALSH